MDDELPSLWFNRFFGKIARIITISRKFQFELNSSSKHRFRENFSPSITSKFSKSNDFETIFENSSKFSPPGIGHRSMSRNRGLINFFPLQLLPLEFPFNFDETLTNSVFRNFSNHRLKVWGHFRRNLSKNLREKKLTRKFKKKKKILTNLINNVFCPKMFFFFFYTILKLSEKKLQIDDPSDEEKVFFFLIKLLFPFG